MSVPNESTAGRIDVRGPRFTASITALTLIVDVYLALIGAHLAAIILLAVVTAVFAVGAFGGVQRNPYSIIFRTVVRPRLAPTSATEDAAPPTFAQGIGFVVTGVGLVVALLGVPLAVVIAAGIAFIAAFLNAVFGYCIGCQVYVLLVRIGVIRPRAAVS